MTLKSLSAALATTALVALTLPALAQDKSGTNAGPAAEGATAGAAATMGLAQELYAVGLAQGDAVAVLAAAKLAASVEVTEAEAGELDLTRVSLTEAGVTVTPAEPADLAEGALRPAAKASFATASSDDDGAADAPVTAEAMFAMAKDLAGDDEALLGLIDDAMAEGSRGRIGGAVKWLSRLPAGMTDVWEIPFYGNSYAEVAIIGDGDANLDVAITDENGNVICYDVSWSDKLYCDWTPAWNGYFYVTVQNVGRKRNSYYLMTN